MNDGGSAVAILQRWSNVLAFILNCSLTFGNNGFGYGKSIEEISDEYQTIITPPGWAFSIWGVIFALEFVFTAWQLFQSSDNLILNEVVGFFWVSACLFQSAWNLTIAAQLFVVSALVLAGIAISLAIICLRITPKEMNKHETVAEYFLVRFSFGLHGGWTCVATLLSFNLAAVANGVSPKGQLVVAIISLAVVVAASLYFGMFKGNLSYSLAICWALFGISSEQGQTSMILGPEIANHIRISSMVCAVSITLFTCL